MYILSNYIYMYNTNVANHTYISLQYIGHSDIVKKRFIFYLILHYSWKMYERLIWDIRINKRKNRKSNETVINLKQIVTLFSYIVIITFNKIKC